MKKSRSMKLGNSIIIIFLSIFFFSSFPLYAQDKIISSPLINLDEIKPSFEEVESTTIENSSNELIQLKKKNLKINNKSIARFIGLDKITAKTSEIVVKLGEAKKFGPLEIKVLKCGKIKSKKLSDNVAYLQVKDTSKNQNEKSPYEYIPITALNDYGQSIQLRHAMESASRYGTPILACLCCSDNSEHENSKQHLVTENAIVICSLQRPRLGIVAPSISSDGASSQEYAAEHQNAAEQLMFLKHMTTTCSISAVPCKLVVT